MAKAATTPKGKNKSGKSIESSQPPTLNTGGSGYSPTVPPTIEVYNAQTYRTGSDAIRYSTRDPDATALMSRCVGYAGMCAMLNATTCAGVPLRLYRKTRGKSNVDRKRREWLRCAVPGYGPGKRVAQYADRSDNIEEVADHPAARIIENPNKFQNGSVFWEYVFLCGQLAGNGYILPATANDSSSEPVELLALMPQFVRVVPDPVNFVAGYTYGGLRQVAVTFPRESVIHFIQCQSPYNPYIGYSPLSLVIVEADLYQASNQYELAMWDNGVTPNMMFVPKDKLTEDQAKQLKAQIASAYRGIGKAGGWMVSPYGIDVKPLTVPLKEMNWGDGRKDVRNAVLNAFGVPETKVEMNSANLASAQVGEVTYRRDTILPILNRMAGTLTEGLLPMFGLEPGEYWYAYDNPVPDDQLAEATRITSFVASGIITINEARQEQGLEPIAGGDRSLTAAALPPETVDEPMVDGEETVEPSEAPVPFDSSRATFVVDVLAKVQDGTLSADSAKTTLEALAGMDAATAAAMVDAQVARKQEADDDAQAKLESVSAEPPSATQPVAEEEADDAPDDAGTDGERTASTTCCGRSASVLVSDLRAAEAVAIASRFGADADPVDDALTPSERAERSIQHKCRAFFADQKATILSNMSLYPSGRQHAVPHVRGPIEDEVERLMKLWAIADGKWTARLTELLRPDVKAATVYGAETAATLILDAKPDTEPLSSFGLDSSAAQGWLRRGESVFLKDMAEVNETTAKQLGDTLAEGLANGEGIERLKERVTAVFDHEVDSGVTASEYRSANIARTETFRANTYGQRATYQGYGVNRMRWVVSSDPCEFCIAFGNQYAAAPIDSPFASKGTTLTGIDGGTMALDYEDIEGPPLHPQCRCSMLPEID